MSALLQQLLPASLTHEGKMSYLYSSFIMVTVTWLSWRIWAFTLKPFLEPREPRLLPYWIPGILSSSPRWINILTHELQ